MIKKYDFSKDCWNKEDFMYVYSPNCKAYKEFIQDTDSIINDFNKNIDDYDYLSIVTKRKYSEGVKVKTVCSFDSYGAPLIVLSDDIIEKDNRLEYVLHFEAVAYENGCNVWHIVPWSERVERPIKPTKIAFSEFKIEDGSKIELTLEVQHKKFIITVNGQTLEVENDEIPKSFHVGITACEGINRFYNLTIEE